MLIDKYSLIVFDLDGTLVHTTAEYRYRIVPYVLKKLGVNKVTESLIDKFWFDGNRNDTINKKRARVCRRSKGYNSYPSRLI